MKRRIAILGVNDDAVAALPALAARPDLELACVFDPEAAALRRRLALYEPRAARLLQTLLTDDPARLDDAELVPAEKAADLLSQSEGHERAAGRERTDELVQALTEIADAVELCTDASALPARLLDAAIAATGASGGSLLRVDADAQLLRVAAAVGLERELWTKVALRLGQGLAGRAWAEGRPIRVAGAADPAHFEIVRARSDVASSACLPLLRGTRTLGVLCLHHHARTDLCADEDDALEAIGARIGRITAHAEELFSMRRRAEAAALDESLHAAIAAALPLEQRLAALCRIAAERVDGVATLWWNEDADAPLRLVASSLPGGALGAAARLAPGDGLDGRAARDRAPVVLANDGALAFAALPLLDGEELLGVLSLQIGANAGADENALRELAVRASRRLAALSALDRARERATRSEAVHEAALRILAAPARDAIAAELATSTALLSGAEQTVVRLLDAERKSFRVCARTGDAIDDDVRALDRDVAREAVRSRRTQERAGDGEERRASLVAPILAGDAVVGTIGAYGRRAGEATRFDPREREVVERLAAYAARALRRETAPAAAPLVSQRILSPDAFARRLDEEIARAHASESSGGAFALLICHIENAEALGALGTAAAMRRLLAAAEHELRAFDTASQSAPDRLTILLPEPGGATAERIARFARALAQRAAVGAEGPPAAIAVGYAIHRDGETSHAALLAAAAEPRIRML